MGAPRAKHVPGHLSPPNPVGKLDFSTRLPLYLYYLLPHPHCFPIFFLFFQSLKIKHQMCMYMSFFTILFIYFFFLRQKLRWNIFKLFNFWHFFFHTLIWSDFVPLVLKIILLYEKNDLTRQLYLAQKFLTSISQ